MRLANLTTERKRAVAEAWQYFVSQRGSTLIADFIAKDADFGKAINGRTAGINKLRLLLQTCEADLAAVEEQMTSTKPTVDGINQVLEAFGFTGFSLLATEDGRQYVISRDDGTNATSSLSEGERTFVTFLYFFYRLQGSLSETGCLLYTSDAADE